MDFFTIYKVPTGKPKNKFAFNGEAKDKVGSLNCKLTGKVWLRVKMVFLLQDFALRIVEETHQQWQRLMKKEAGGGSICL